MEVCNKIEDCISGEDEYFCDLPNKCPKPCSCLMYAAVCQNASSPFSNIFYVLILQNTFLKLNKIIDSTNNMLLSDRMLIFVWQNSNVTRVCHQHRLNSKALQLLDVASNKIHSLQDECFASKDLKFVFMSQNDIGHISIGAFVGLRRMLKLDISSNCLSDVFLPTFPKGLQLFNISDNPFQASGHGICQHTHIDVIATTDYSVCCLLGNVAAHCTSQPKWPQHCNALLNPLAASVVAHIMFSVMSILTVVSLMANFHNLIKSPEVLQKGSVMIVQKDNQSKGFILSMFFVHINDALYAVCLFCLCIAHDLNGSDFTWSRDEWISSLQCRILGFFSFVFSLDSLFLSNILTTSRLMAVKYPFKVQLKDSSNVLCCLIGGKIIWCSIGVLC